MSETREIVSVITCDLEGRIETFNPNAEKLFGYKAEEVVGKKVSVLTNLEPKTIRGVKSQGMLLMAEDGDGHLIFISPEDKNTPSGLNIR